MHLHWTTERQGITTKIAEHRFVHLNIFLLSSNIFPTQDCGLIHSWSPEREAGALPARPPQLDLWLKDNARYGGRQARRIWRRWAVLLVRFVASARDLGPALQLLDQLSAEEMEATLFVVSSEEVSQHPIFSTTVSTINYQHINNTNSAHCPQLEQQLLARGLGPDHVALNSLELAAEGR